MRVELATEQDLGRWQTFVDEHPSAGPFHHSGWFHVLSDCFSVQPCFLQAVDEDNTLLGVLPAYFSSSLLAGKHLTTMEQGALCRDRQVEEALYAGALKVRDAKNGGYLLLRGCADGLVTGSQVRVPKVRTIVPISDDNEQTWKKLTSNTRRKIRKAGKNGFSAEQDNNKIVDFYNIYAQNMRHLGTPVMTRRMMLSIQRHLANKMRLYTVRYQGMVVGGSLCILSSSTLSSLYVAIAREILPLYPTYLLYWSLIEGASQSGVARLDLGRSVPESGTHKFKQQWGGIDVYMNYTYCYKAASHAKGRLLDTGADKTFKRRIWSSFPLAITNSLGPMLRRQLPFL
jgi:hypothetical protein